MQRHLDAFTGVPGYVHEAIVAAHLRAATAHPVTDEELEPYLTQWLDTEGQAAYYRHGEQLDERYTREIEPRYGELAVPTLVLWGRGRPLARPQPR